MPSISRRQLKAGCANEKLTSLQTTKSLPIPEISHMIPVSVLIAGGDEGAYGGTSREMIVSGGLAR